MRLEIVRVGVVVALIGIMAGCADLAVINVDPTWVQGDRRVTVNMKNVGQSGVTRPFSVTVEAHKRNFDYQNAQYRSEAMISLSQSVNALASGESRTLEFRFPDIATYLYNPAAVRKVIAHADSGYNIQEWTEENNIRAVCVSQSVPDRVCWLQDPCLIAMADVDLTVRTVNTHGGAERYPKRLKGITEKFYQDWPNTIGLIGMQEVKEEMTACPGVSGTVHGAQCLAQLMGSKYNSGYSWAYRNSLGIVVGPDWEMLSYDSWELGKDSLRHLGARSTRYLLETRLRHRTHGWILRFYSTHLSHGDQESQRNEQIDKLTEIILERAQPGELLPIIVGDFNFSPNAEPSSNSRMSTKFFLVNWQAIGCDNGQPASVGIDHVWIGDKGSFPRAIGRNMVLRFTTTRGQDNGVDLVSNYTVDDYTGELSDHNSPGFGFKLLDVRR